MDSNKEVQEKLLQGFVNTNDEINYAYRKRFTKVGIIVLLIVTLRMIFGPLVIPNVFGFPAGYNRYFLVKYNNEPVSVEYKLVNKTPIIPFLVYVKSSYNDVSKYTKEDIKTIYITDSTDIKLSIKSYGCYNSNSRVRCSYYDDNLKKVKKLKFETMKITYTTKPYKVIYDGAYISNIGELIKENGSYTINIVGKYRRNKVYLDTYVIKIPHQEIDNTSF